MSSLKDKIEDIISSHIIVGQVNTDKAADEILLSYTGYWKQRCLLAEQCLEESPCDPDITSDQIKAWNAYHKFISCAGNNC